MVKKSGVSLKSRAKNKTHKQVGQLRKTNTTLPSTLHPNLPSSSSAYTLPYRTAPNVHDNQICDSIRKNPLPPAISLNDRKAHAEAFLVSFIAEHSLPFSVMPQLVPFVQELSKDSRTLQSLSMSRITAAYKMRDGLGASISEDIIKDLRKSFFSMNVDECMANAYEKIFSIIMSYFSKDLKRLLVHHYNSKTFMVKHRWLSTYDATVVDLPLLPALSVMYFAWMPTENRSTYIDVVNGLLLVSIFLLKIYKEHIFKSKKKLGKRLKTKQSSLIFYWQFHPTFHILECYPVLGYEPPGDQYQRV